MTEPREVKGQLEMMLLALIATEEQHGYAVIRRLHERSNGRFDLKEGTVYPALHRLETAGLVRSRVIQVVGRQRRLYSLTVEGSTSLAERRSDWVEFSTTVSAVLGMSP